MLSMILAILVNMQMIVATIVTLALNPTAGWMITTLIALLSLELIFKPLRLLINYVRVELRPEPKEQEFGTLVGPAHLDPVRGILSTCVYKGEEFKVVIQPEWWNLVYPSALSQDRVFKEGAIQGVPYSKVATGTEPKSLVVLYSGGSRAGMGARVSWEGEDLLLTASHVWNKLPEEFGMGKNGSIVEVRGANVYADAPNPQLDFALIRIPNKYWSRLAVSATALIPCRPQSIVKVYGGKTDELVSSFGRVDRHPDLHVKLIHRASTAPGWSGSPLYDSKGFIQGLHTGGDVFGHTNEAVDVAELLACLSRKETVYSDIGLTLIDADEIPSRGYEFIDFEIRGERALKGKIKGGEVAVLKPVKGRPWDEYSDSDSDYGEPLPHLKESTKETLLPDSSHLNCQRAAPLELPFQNLNESIGVSQNPSPQVECSSTELDARLVGLERAVSTILEELSLLRASSSPSSMNTDGRKEAPGPSSTPCSYKQVDSKEQKPQETSNRPSKVWQPSIPRVEPKDVSGSTTSATRKSSRRRSRKSQNQAKSTGKPVLDLHGQNLRKETQISSITSVTSSKKPCDCVYLS